MCKKREVFISYVLILMFAFAMEAYAARASDIIDTATVKLSSSTKKLHHSIHIISGNSYHVMAMFNADGETKPLLQ